jgi:hypothetical protein
MNEYRSGENSLAIIVSYHFELESHEPRFKYS